MKMQVAWFHRFGEPEEMVLEETTCPMPGPGEALVRVRAVGVNHVDLDLRAGTSCVPIQFPHILGREFSGEVAVLGDASGRFKEGDRVWVASRTACGQCEFCWTGRDNLCEQGHFFGMALPGGYAQYVKVPVVSLRALHPQMGFEQAAASQIAFGTAWHVLMNRGGLQAGQTVLIQAAGSGIGSAAVQVAKFAGATVLATAGSESKLARAQALGADHLINYNQHPRFSEQVLALTHGKGVDLVMEHIGGDVFTQSLASLKTDGKIVTVGAHAGEVVPLDIIPFFRRQLQLIGSRNANFAEINAVMDLVAQGRFQPVIHAAMPLSQAAQAHRTVGSRDVFGKVVLLP